MPSRPYDLPPLSALVSFEAAARHVSFRSASRELNVTPAAISHQVKALEVELGQALFHRRPRGVDLTEAGALLLVALQRGFGDMSETITRLRRKSENDAIVIQATSAMSSLWLTPRLARFWKTHQTIAVTQHVTDSARPADNADLIIQYGDMPRGSQDCRELFRDRIAALASPELARRHRVASMVDLATVPLIHLTADNPEWTSWQEWAAIQGYTGKLGAGIAVNNYAIAVQAAQDEMGFVLGWEALTGQLVRTGMLEQVLPNSIPSPRCFFITTRPGASARALRLRDWLLEEAAQMRG